AELQAQTDTHQAELKQQTDTHSAQLKAATEAHKAEVDQLKDANKTSIEQRKLDQADRHHNEEMDLKRKQALRDHNLKVSAQNKVVADEILSPADGEEPQAEQGELPLMQNPFEAVAQKIDSLATVMEGIVELAKQQAQQTAVIAEGQQQALELAAKPKK